MREIALFVEDYGHKQIIGALVQRLAQECNVDVWFNWRNARHGYGALVQELKEYLRDLERQGGQMPDLIIVGTDANCKGLNGRIKELEVPDAPAPIIYAVPDPHVERWLLLDGAAFKAVFGKGCDAPDLKCARDRYKQRLVQATYATGVTPTLGGIEFAEDIICKMNINRASRTDKSIRLFVNNLRKTLQSWN